MPAQTASAASGGPDAFKYRFVDSAEPDGPAYGFEDISSTGTALTLKDEGGPQIPIGFAFEFYGAVYSYVYVASNAYLRFGERPADTCCPGQVIPGAEAPSGMIAGYYGDWDPVCGGSVHYLTTGSAGSRKLIVQFKDILRRDALGACMLTRKLTMQFKLFEANNIIEVHYLGANGVGARFSAGIEKQDGSTGLQYFLGSNNSTPSLAGVAVRYFRDLAPPETTITSGPQGLVDSRDATFAFASSESPSTFECSRDGGAFSACQTPKSYTGLADGPHSFEVRATDVAGNTDPTPATRTWTIDATPPDTSITSGPPASSSSTSATLAFVSSEPNSTFACSLDGQMFTACVTPKSYSGLSVGDHTFRVKATDAASNEDPTPASTSWTIDTSPPDTTITAGPSGTVATTSATFEFVSSESPSTFECSLDGTAFAACQTPSAHTGLPDGPHTFNVRATDAAGNTDPTPASRTWTVDVSAPDTTITAGPSGLTASSQASFEFTSTEAGSSFACALDAGSFLPCSTPAGYSALPEGAHTFRVRAIDLAGNVDPTPASRDWTIDSVAPDTVITSGPSGMVASQAATFEFTATQAGSTFECELDSAGFAACTPPAAYTSLAQGAHTFRVRATDPAGNTDPTPATQSWTVDTSLPDTSIVSGPSGVVSSSSASFHFSSTEAGSTFQCSIDGAEFSGCSTPAAYSALSDGAHTFAVRAIDPAGNVDPTPAARGWTVDTRPPDTMITAGPSGTVATGSATFEFAATEAGSTFQCVLDAGSFVPCISPSGYSGLADGIHRFEVRATDAAGNTDPTPAARNWTVDSGPPDTTITSGPSGIVNDTSATLEFVSSEANSTFQCALDSAAFSSCTSPADYQGLAPGPHTFRVRATDPAGNTDPSPATRSWTIDTSPPDTTITAGPSGLVASATAVFEFVSSEAGSTFQCALDASDWTACTSPKAYTGLADGAHAFRVRAIDPAGNLDPTPAIREWTVDTVPPETVITAGPSGTVNVTTATFEFTATEPSSFQCALDLGDWSVCSSPATYGSIGHGPHTFRVRATDLAGNVDPTPATRSWGVDVRGPQVRFTSPERGSVVVRDIAQARVHGEKAIIVALGESVELKAEATDETGIALVRFLVDGAVLCVVTSSPYTCRWEPPLLGAEHLLEVEAIDEAGNLSPRDEVRILVV